jgi:hypothetical protein
MLGRPSWTWLTPALAAFVLTAATGATEPVAGSARAFPLSSWQRLSLTFTNAIAFGGTAPSLESAMRDEGFSDTSGGCAPDAVGCRTRPLVSHPYSERLGGPGDTWAVHARYQLTPRLGLGLSLSGAPLQTTFGYRMPRDGVFATFTSVDSKATTLAALLSVGNGESAWAGFGPSVNFLVLEVDEFRRSKATAPGLVVELGARAPKDSRVYFEAVWQYRYVVPVHMTPPSLSRTHEIGFSHWGLMAGIGVRLGRDRRP